MLQYYITDRRSLGGAGALLHTIARHDAAGVDYIQIREKDLDAAALAELVCRALEACRHARVIVNTRADVALACGAAGMHLPAGAPPARLWRPVAPPDFLIGVSCHSLEELRRAEDEGASYAFFAPVFRPRSKPDHRPPLGLDALGRACAAVHIPVFALGGITRSNAPLCIEAGAAGVAGITLFQDPP